VFAQGIAEKGPDSVPSRDTQLLFVGFSPRRDMTRGKAPVINRSATCVNRWPDAAGGFESQSREWALRFAMLPRFLSDDYKQREIRRYAPFQATIRVDPATYKRTVDDYISNTGCAGPQRGPGNR